MDSRSLARGRSLRCHYGDHRRGLLHPGWPKTILPRPPARPRKCRPHSSRTHPRFRSVKIWSVVIAVMLIFGAGVVTGGLLVRTRVVQQQTAPQPSPTIAATPPNPTAQPANLAPGRQIFIQRVRRELDLTADQSAKVDEIMAE